MSYLDPNSRRPWGSTPAAGETALRPLGLKAMKCSKCKSGREVFRYAGMEYICRHCSKSGYPVTQVAS